MLEEFFYPTEFPIEVIRRASKMLIGGDYNIPRLAKDLTHVLCYVEGMALGDPDRNMPRSANFENELESNREVLEELLWGLRGVDQGHAISSFKELTLTILLKQIIEAIIERLIVWVALQ